MNKKPEKLRRKVRVPTVWTEDEAKKLDQGCARTRLDRSNYIRMAVFEKLERDRRGS